MRIGQTSLFTAIIWLCCSSAIAQDIKAGQKMYSDAERKQANTAADLRKRKKIASIISILCDSIPSVLPKHSYKITTDAPIT